ncbi:hypothetical protein K1W69_25515 [Hoeflea sp. WL0058]|uniref:Uncharacterized protein n=1 Tax=Flavimaribacter sediminis TaxID=2865987 RepID=A0AAE2ZVP4_9HYPH|nr:hypothetical protein [Flavimaribacter sediminis]MBW8640577.1 hypothetical protein [Flavimaribacter sediminis]
MIATIPLMIIPLIAYNAILFAPVLGQDFGALTSTMFSLEMLSGAVWTMDLSAMLIAAALVLLFVEILKATRTGSWSLVDHLLSTLVFIAFLVEFLTVRQAATGTFFLLTAIALIDLVAGFSVAIRSAGRDVAIGL